VRPRLAAALVTLALVAPAMRAPAAGAVAPCAGVMVVVDFGHWGGAVEQHCVANPSNGLDALHEAGFSTSGTLKEGPAFVCRIDGLPTKADDACVVDPPTTAYWGYYWAHPGDASWTYSDTGATGRTPPAGTIDAWAFGANALPRISPTAFPRPAPPASQPPNPASGPVARPSTAPAATSGAVGGPAGSKVTAPKSTNVRALARVPTSAATPTTAGVNGATREPRSTTTTTALRVIDRAAAPALVHASDGSPWPVFLALVLLAALGAGAFFVIRARRRPA
jgi:hypothetical protein